MDVLILSSSQSTATMREMSSKGKPTEDNTNIIVINPAEGTDAAPTDAAVAVKLQQQANGGDILILCNFFPTVF